LFPDAHGSVPARATIAAGAPPSLRGRAAFSRLLAAARMTRVRTKLSRDAGTYLCNYVYWRALEAAAQPSGPRRAVFIHVPPVGQAPRPRGRARRHAFTPDELFRAGDAIVLALSRR
jgi:pyroglutamyl-peptidase